MEGQERWEGAARGVEGQGELRRGGEGQGEVGKTSREGWGGPGSDRERQEEVGRDSEQ